MAKQISGTTRKRHTAQWTIGPSVNMCSKRTQRPTFYEVFGRIVLDPKIFCELDSIRWGRRVGSGCPEAFHSYLKKEINVSQRRVGTFPQYSRRCVRREKNKAGERTCSRILFLHLTHSERHLAGSLGRSRRLFNALKLGCLRRAACPRAEARGIRGVFFCDLSMRMRI